MALVGDDEQSAEGTEYTIDELSARTGLSVRTIRFYQTKGAIPPPARRGRSAYYTDRHIGLLNTIIELRDRGERLEAIIEFIHHTDPRYGNVGSIIGLRDRAEMAWTADRPALWNREEIIEHVGFDRPGLITDFERLGAIARQGYSRPVMYLVPSPLLLRTATRMMRVGVPVDTLVETERAMREAMVGLVPRLLALYSPTALGGPLAAPAAFVDALPEIRQATTDTLQMIVLQELARTTQELLADDESLLAFLGLSSLEELMDDAAAGAAPCTGVMPFGGREGPSERQYPG